MAGSEAKRQSRIRRAAAGAPGLLRCARNDGGGSEPLWDPNRETVRWSSSLLGRPSGGVAEFIGVRQVSWLAACRRRNLPGLGSSPVAQKSVGTPLTVAGAATDRRMAYRVPFSPSCKIEGPYAAHVPASSGVVKCDATRAWLQETSAPACAKTDMTPHDLHKAKMIKRKAARDAEVAPTT
jgi:hypothetical protein